MLKPYVVELRLYVNDRLCHISNPKLDLLSDEEVATHNEFIKEGKDFDSLWEFLSNKCCDQYLSTSILTKKRKIKFYQNNETFKENDVVKWEYKYAIRPYKHLKTRDFQIISADKVIQYCAERGLVATDLFKE